VLKAAWDKARPEGIQFVLSGHTHLFELLTLSEGRPAQLVAGDGGTQLANPLPMKLEGIQVEGAAIAGGESVHDFGFTLLLKSGSGWDVSLKE
jgi:hypothetical protein